MVDPGGLGMTKEGNRLVCWPIMVVYEDSIDELLEGEEAGTSGTTPCHEN